MLIPNNTYKINGVTVNEKIIPDGTVWKDNTKAKKAGFSGAGSLYKKNKKIAGGPKSVTIHNTGDLNNVYDDGEQYTRATYNENMGSARVHFYVDDTGAWQNLKAGTGLCPNDPEGSAEVSWHSGDGSVSDGGNMTSLSMEIIMGESTDHDAKAKDNAAKIAAWLLWKYKLPISKLVTHTYWVNKSAGKTFADPDEQCTNLIYGKKWCPSYIFGSYSHAIALGNWKTFKALVKNYLDQLNTSAVVPTQPKPDVIKVGDKVKCKAGITKYYNGAWMPSWVRGATLYVRQIEQGGKVYLVSTEPIKKEYTGRVWSSDVMKI